MAMTMGAASSGGAVRGASCEAMPTIALRPVSGAA